MSIHVLQNATVFQLQTRHSSYQIAVGPCGYPLHLWYGAKLPPEALTDTLCLQDIGYSGNPYDAGRDRTLSPDTLPMEYPGFGCGDYRDAAVALRFADGSLGADFRFAGYEIVSGHLPVPGLPHALGTETEPCETLILRLREAASPVTAELIYGVYEQSDVITRGVRVVNGGGEAVALERCLSCSLDFQQGSFDLMTFHGRHLMERQPQRAPVTRARSEICSLRGMSSHQTNPALLLCRPDTGETHGDCWGLCLAYSGNFTGSAQTDQRGQTRVNLGLHPEQFSWRLGPGEAFDAPQAILAFSDEGFDALSRRFHRFLRGHVCRSPWVRRRRPVLINSWEAAYFNFDRERLLALARSAKALNLDMLVLDDGWFGHRDNDDSSLGDWTANTAKLGGTLADLARDVHGLGLGFGLWVEPEMVSEDSDLYRAHPDWALTMPGRRPTRSRYQLVLDMSRPEVRDYLWDSLRRLLDGAAIDYIKWDFNRSVCDLYSHAGGARQGETAHRWMLGVYELLEKLVDRYPDLLLETCAGGGGRFDAGMLYYSPQIWCSDDTDAVNRAMIQYGTSFFYPASAMASHVSVCPNHQTGRVVPMDTRFSVALTGALGYELDATKLSADEAEAVRAQAAAYDALESLPREGSYHRLTGAGGQHMAWSYVSEDQSRALVVALMLTAEGNEIPPRVFPRNLKPGARYRCPELGQTHSGAVWMGAGLLLAPTPAQYEARRFTLEEEA